MDSFKNAKNFKESSESFMYYWKKFEMKILNNVFL